MKRFLYKAEPKPQDLIKIRCDKTSDERLFKVGKIYDGCWLRLTDGKGYERTGPGYARYDENGENYGTYRSPWFEFTIVEGLTEPPKE